uniref:Uncharacterized mitochondrial protein AtMg00810-like n=1 Tax=Nicotiana tabacum TaxID=4097 RepID=A0A1S4AQ29_TOBAC|nr:PREDICTED: uncharacterized mitochondrial protein AtMg00810-like [Nicotiana tabacum]
MTQEFEALHVNHTRDLVPLPPGKKAIGCRQVYKAKVGAILNDPTYYRKLIGKLNFPTNTRLDIAYRVQQLSQFVQDPREPHLKATLYLLRYLRSDPILGIFFSNDPVCTIQAYCDSEWAACLDSRRSVSGYIILLGDSPVSWKSKKQETVSLSSAEAEYRSLQKVVGELTWLCRLLEELTVPFPKPVTIFCDIQSALHIARNHVFYERTKRIEVDCHFLRAKPQEGLIDLTHVSLMLNWQISSPKP